MKRKAIILGSSFIFILLVSLMWYITAPSEIISTKNFEPIEMALKNADKDTLVVFDVDEVLTMSTNQIFHRPVDEKLMGELLLDLKTRLGEAKTDFLISIIMLQETVKLVEPKIISHINGLQMKGIPIMALTAISTGKYGKIPSLEDWRIQKLKSMGISLKKQWSNIKTKQFSNFKSKEIKGFGWPVFKSGILFSSKIPKGKALQAFLQYAKLKPKKIIFVDDVRENLESVQEICNQSDIEFRGFEYSGANIRTEPVNKTRARLLCEVLEKEHKWLSDQEADRRLAHSKKIIQPILLKAN